MGDGELVDAAKKATEEASKAAAEPAKAGGADDAKKDAEYKEIEGALAGRIMNRLTTGPYLGYNIPFLPTYPYTSGQYHPGYVAGLPYQPYDPANIVDHIEALRNMHGVVASYEIARALQGPNWLPPTVEDVKKALSVDTDALKKDAAAKKE